MPELPEVETVRRGLEAAVQGAVIKRAVLRRANLRFPFPDGLTDMLAGAQITSIERRAKYLLFTLGAERFLGHLGMTGSFVVRPHGHTPQPHEHMVWVLEDGREVVYHDPRRFGFFLQLFEKEEHPLLASLGIEPLSDAFTPAYMQERMLGRRTPIKSWLMDAHHIVGIGNIYASEALFRSRLHPATPADACMEVAALLHESIRTVLEAALASGGSTLRNYANAEGEAGYFQHHFAVYGRAGQPCEVCTTPIIRITQAGRSSFFCPSCQPTFSA
jgi:formamidopyrimidine-DNA glycosylase